MTPWIKVVTEPLGLAGFALFLIFGYLAKVKRDDERRWLSPVAFAIAAVALIGCLAIAYVQIPKPVQPSAPSVQTSKPAAPTQQQTNQQIQQTSTGEGSPNVQGVQGDVTITVDQSKGKTETQKPDEKKPKPEIQ